MANLTFSLISKSCDKLLIGKTYWKSTVQPRALSSSDDDVDKGGKETIAKCRE